MDATDWDRRYAEAELPCVGRPEHFRRRGTRRTVPGRRSDLACGEGRNALWLASLGWQVAGLDYSSVALERARALAATRGLEVSWQQRDLMTWATDAQVDLVLVAYLHLPPADRQRLMRAARAAVAPGGRLLLVGHDLRNLVDGTGGP
jgi:2-polyprenyl-3-methyl-5-hydroxy-6-metoxy-1,4-benzoquinol methylase